MEPFCLGKVTDRGRSGKDNRFFIIVEVASKAFTISTNQIARFKRLLCRYESFGLIHLHVGNAYAAVRVWFCSILPACHISFVQ